MLYEVNLNKIMIQISQQFQWMLVSINVSALQSGYLTRIVLWQILASLLLVLFIFFQNVFFLLFATVFVFVAC